MAGFGLRMGLPGGALASVIVGTFGLHTPKVTVIMGAAPAEGLYHHDHLGVGGLAGDAVGVQAPFRGNGADWVVSIDRWAGRA